LGLLFSEPGGLSIQIGIYGSEPRIEARLQAYGGADWTLIRYTDRERLRQDVANRRLELGYVFGDEGITNYISPATVTDRVTNLLVAAAYLETIAGDIGASALNPFMETNDETIAGIQLRAEEFLIDGPLMERVVVVYGGEADGDIEMIPFRRLFHGLLALFAQLLAMLCAMRFASKSEKSILRQIKIAGRGKGVTYTLAGVGIVFILTGVVITAVVLSGAWLFPGVWAARDALSLIPYLFVISGLAAALAMWLPEEIYPGVLVVSFIFTALMGGVIFDLREVLDSVGFLRFLFPSYYYMVAVMGR